MGFLLLTGALEEDVPPPPRPRTLLEEGQTSLDAEKVLQPQRFELEAELAPKYARLTGDTIAGLMEQMGPTTRRESALATTAQRTADVGDVEQLGPRAIAAFKSANPELAGLLDEFSRQASSELAAGTTLTPELRREIQQSVRAGQAARGMGTGRSDVYEEAMASGSAGLALQDRRRQFAGNVAQMQSGIANIPFQQILGRPVVSLPMQQASTAQGVQTAAAATPSFDPFSGYASDLYNTNYNAAWTDTISTKNNNAAIRGALIGAIGSIIGGAAGGAAGGV